MLNPFDKDRGKVKPGANPLPEESGESEPRILVVGTGAIGGFYGGKLAQAGARVSTLCRSDYETVRTHGISIKSGLGDFVFKPEKVVRHASEYGPPPEFILVGLKVLPEIDTVEIVRQAVGRDSAIVLLQNGVEIEEPVARAFPDNEIISGLAFVCLNRTGPGQVDHLDYGRLVIGRFPGGTSARAEQMGKLFNQAGVPCTVTDDVVTARWRKLVWNAPYNPMSVLGGGADTTSMMENPESATLARRIMEEVCRVAEAAGHPLPPEVVEENLEGTRKMSPYKTSMLIDVEEGRPLEVEAIMGNALRVAERHGIAVPHLESLHAMLTLVDRKIRMAHGY
jgi:2-dehydropantoate 2-reductase